MTLKTKSGDDKESTRELEDITAVYSIAKWEFLPHVQRDDMVPTHIHTHVFSRVQLCATPWTVAH